MYELTVCTVCTSCTVCDVRAVCAVCAVCFVIGLRGRCTRSWLTPLLAWYGSVTPQVILIFPMSFRLVCYIKSLLCPLMLEVFYKCARSRAFMCSCIKVQHVLHLAFSFSFPHRCNAVYCCTAVVYFFWRRVVLSDPLAWCSSSVLSALLEYVDGDGNDDTCWWRWWSW